MIFHWCMTIILSIFIIVESLWAMISTVLFCMSSLIASWMRNSDSLSSAEVASSITMICLFSRIALAIATLCLSPHESLIPLSQTRVSYPSLRAQMNSWHLAIFDAAMISCSVASGFPYAILSLMLLWKRTGSCGIIEIFSLSEFCVTFAIF